MNSFQEQYLPSILSSPWGPLCDTEGTFLGACMSTAAAVAGWSVDTSGTPIQKIEVQKHKVKKEIKNSF